ncbi:hypothetical protein C8J57DRAFT_195549 [Mycena rebaudengoi]|nr:hypothetical protein C8J57DRAFT_195549 [Mycena rebaudengoi]
MPSMDSVLNSLKFAAPIEVRDCPAEECNLPADVILRSSDGVLFNAHTKNLEIFSGGFPPSSFIEYDEKETVDVTESATVLALLLRYMHNQRQPDSRQFHFETLAGLAEAAEKYQVYSAMEVCKIKMQLSIPLHALDVFIYAAKHDYPDVMDAAAPSTISTPLSTATKALEDHPEILIAWVQYREGFLQQLCSFFKPLPTVKHKGGDDTCDEWAPFQQHILNNFRGWDRLDQMRSFSSLLKLNLFALECKYCKIRAQGWQAVADRVEVLPPLSSFLLRC